MSNRTSPHYADRKLAARDNIRRNWDDLILPSSALAYDVADDMAATAEYKAFRSVYSLFAPRKSDH